MIGIAHIRRRKYDFTCACRRVLVPRPLRSHISCLLILGIRRIPAVKITPLIIHIQSVKGIPFNFQHSGINPLQEIPDTVRVRAALNLIAHHLHKQPERMPVILHNRFKLCSRVLRPLLHPPIYNSRFPHADNNNRSQVHCQKNSDGAVQFPAPAFL